MLDLSSINSLAVKANLKKNIQLMDDIINED
jgi:hypothetical protein